MHSHKILNIATQNPSLAQTLARGLDISRITAQLLINRGIKTVAEGRYFLDASLAGLHDPFGFGDMPLAVNYVKKTLKQKEKILVFGDYDVDGVTSLVLLKSVLAGMGAQVEQYIPHRLKEGYGLSRNIVRLAKERNAKLLITADCGTNSTAQINELRSCGIEVIVTDHHEPAGHGSAACSYPVINPKVETSGYGFRELAGVGVAYKLCQALSGRKLEDELDLVCLGTIADSVPLTGENRILVKAGLPRIGSTGRAGLKALMRSSGIKDAATRPETVSFILGPRINASGRLDSAELALRLLLTDDGEEARELAQQVEALNRQRQKIESQIMEEARDLIAQEVNFKEHNVMVVAKEGWHLGVLGIVASKLADHFYRPAILISLNKGLCRGSGRSIKNFHLFNGLMECKPLLDDFGGHSHAIGMVIPQANIDEFKSRINTFARQHLRFEDLIPSLGVDMQLSLSDISRQLLSECERLEPFGVGNPEPLFYTAGLKLKGMPRLLSRDTLKFWVTDGMVTYPAIGFGMGSLWESLTGAQVFDLVYKPKIDTWQGQSSIILEIKEIFFK